MTIRRFAGLWAALLCMGIATASAESGPTSARALSDIASSTAAADPGSDLAARALARPLFTPLRRPAAALPPRALAEAPGLPRLSGTMQGQFGKRAMLVLGERTLVVAEGDRVGDWTVSAIGRGAATVSSPISQRNLFVGVLVDKPGLPTIAKIADLPFWSTPCGRSHRLDRRGGPTIADPEQCRALLLETAVVEVNLTSINNSD